jgi:hypothetical protein
MPWTVFEELNREREQREEPLFANPRNAASGTLKSQNSAVVASRKLDAYLYYLLGEELPHDGHYENLQEAARNDSSVLLASAIALAIGMGIQNFPEGAAIALPLRQSGMSRAKAFGLGTLSGIVEPVFGLLTVLAAGAIQPLLPWLLAFAAGAMLYVVVEELIPEAHLGEGHMGTVGVMLGFLLMMILDVALG